MKDTAVAREYIWMITSSIAFWLFAYKGLVTHIEGVVLFSGIIVFTFYLIHVTIRDRKNFSSEEVIPVESKKLKHLAPSWRVIIYLLQIVLGIGLLVWGSEITIEAATYIARVLGVSEVIIGLSLVAFGTSLPELATAIISIIRREKAILIGNVIGSNIFNILFVGGAVSTIFTISVKKRLVQIDIPIMLFISIVLFPLLFMRKKISRISGISLLVFYLLYIFYIYFNN
jgi:cation:H+ antiporter